MSFGIGNLLGKDHFGVYVEDYRNQLSQMTRQKTSIDLSSTSSTPNSGLLPSDAPLISLQCTHCSARFRSWNNSPGSCSKAPDRVKIFMQKVTCYPCAESMSYHCLSDAEGDYPKPCSCDTSEGNCFARWLGLILMSLCLPCLCCYPVCMSCYWCGLKSKLCGGKHETVDGKK